MNSALCTASTLVSGANVDAYVFADKVYLSPSAHRQFGNYAYDKLRAAQALAPDDAEVRRAAARLLPATRSCFEEQLRGNRVRRARACYDAWQTLEPRNAQLPDARRRLAQKWIAVGGERLGAGEVAFAAEALREARGLDAGAPGLAEFAARVRSAQAGGD